MKYLDEFRDAHLVKSTLEAIHERTSHPWVLMEICGGQTHSLKRYGIDQLLPDEIELVHGPGCPVCVTPLEMIDQAQAIASRPEVIFTSFGDMLRVPGSDQDLFRVRANGGDVRVVYSPLDAVQIAIQNPESQVVFFAIGFETTAPANAASVLQASQLNLDNFSVLVSHVRVPPAIEAILESPNNRIQAFLAAGHVCAVMGYWEYPELAAHFRVPIVVTGFEPLDLLQGILMAVNQLESGISEVQNAYTRAVTRQGNQAAQEMIHRVFGPCDRKWRGIGSIPNSGLELRPEFSTYDAARKFPLTEVNSEESPLCEAGLILQGLKKPPECSVFGTLCTPEHPLGATMVSSEGACAAYFKYSPQPAQIEDMKQ